MVTYAPKSQITYHIYYTFLYGSRNAKKREDLSSIFLIEFSQKWFDANEKFMKFQAIFFITSYKRLFKRAYLHLWLPGIDCQSMF